MKAESIASRVPATEQHRRVHTSAIHRAARSRRSGRKIEAKTAHRHLVRPVREAIGEPTIRRAHHAYSDEYSGELPGRKVADQEPRKSMRVLRSRLYEVEMQKQATRWPKNASRCWFRRPLRKIRTYNFPRTVSPTTASASHPPTGASHGSYSQSSTADHPLSARR